MIAKKLINTHFFQCSIYYTRANLREALIDLLQHTTYALVNVTDIAKQAGVNRVTFYNHYSSKDELIEEILELLIEEYVALINKYEPAELELFIQLNYTHYDQHAKGYKLLLSEEFPEYKKIYIEHLQQSIRSILMKMRRNPNINDENYNFLIEWNVGGTLQTIHNYLKEETRPSPEILSQRVIWMTTSMFLD
jgi:AcrR family transcriptional regulator